MRYLKLQDVEELKQDSRTLLHSSVRMLKIGDRVSVGHDHGVVRYIGPVDGYDGEWVGIDWDNPKRGKHDGSVKGKRYFQASSSKSGSFVRLQAVETGKDLLEEMKRRYTEFAGDSRGELGSKTWHFPGMSKVYKIQRLFEAFLQPGHPLIERLPVIGYVHFLSDRTREPSIREIANRLMLLSTENLWQLKVIMVDNMKVARAPPKNCAPFKFCTELNLHSNLLSRWCDLFDILDLFPALRILIASCNYMESGMKTIADEQKISAPIDTLVLFQCGLDETTTNRIFHFFRHIRQIHLGENNLKSFDPGEYGNNLEYIDLEKNPVNDFSNIHNLSALPKLRYLNIIDCGLKEIHLPDPIGFSSLKSLAIKRNPLDNKQWISEVAKLPVLENLSYHSALENNAITDCGIDMREIIIAKIPQLKVLEKSLITVLERRSSEIHFLNKFGIPPVADEDKADVERLIKLHGEPMNSAAVFDTGIGLLKVRLSYEEKIVERSLPETVTIQRLTGIVSRLFHLDARKISLQIHGDDGFVMDLDNPLRPLNFYSLRNEDTIYVKTI